MIDWENTKGKSPTPRGGYKRNMEVVLEACDAVIATGDLELIARYFKSIVMYELYGEEPDEEVLNDRTASIAYRTQTNHTDNALNTYREKCIKNWENKTRQTWPPKDNHSLTTR